MKATRTWKQVQHRRTTDSARKAENFKKTFYSGIKKREVLEDKFKKIFTIPMHLKLQNFAERN